MCRGDQHDPEIVEYFLDQNILGYFGLILEDPENRNGDVAIQILQVWLLVSCIPGFMYLSLTQGVLVCVCVDSEHFDSKYRRKGDDILPVFQQSNK